MLDSLHRLIFFGDMSTWWELSYMLFLGPKHKSINQLNCVWCRRSLRLISPIFRLCLPDMHRSGQVAIFMGPTWGPPGSCRPQIGPCWPHEPCYQGADLTSLQLQISWCQIDMKAFINHHAKSNKRALSRGSYCTASRWRHQIESYSALLALSEGNSPVTGELVNSLHKGQWRGALMIFYLRLNKWSSKPSGCRWFEPPSRSLWRHCNAHQNIL